jgi:ACS family D-galactonate transporter-like MFS transporter
LQPSVPHHQRRQRGGVSKVVYARPDSRTRERTGYEEIRKEQDQRYQPPRSDGGIPGSLLGGYFADRSRNLRMFVFVPLLIVSALLILIPVVPNQALWALGIAIGFFLIFGFAAWLAVPARVSKIEHQFIGTATGLMLALAAVGGFFIPIIFGHLVPHTSFDTGWVFLAIVSFAFALIGLAGRNPVQEPMVTLSRP